MNAENSAAHMKLSGRIHPCCHWRFYTLLVPYLSLSSFQLFVSIVCAYGECECVCGGVCGCVHMMQGVCGGQSQFSGHCPLSTVGSGS